MSERFFRSNRPGYPHPVSYELENSGIRVAVGDCSVTERRRWRPPYQTGKTVHVHAKHYTHNKDGRTAPGVCGNGSVPLSHSGNVVTRIGIHTHTHIYLLLWNIDNSTTNRSKLLTYQIIGLKVWNPKGDIQILTLIVPTKNFFLIFCFFLCVCFFFFDLFDTPEYVLA